MWLVRGPLHSSPVLVWLYFSGLALLAAALSHASVPSKTEMQKQVVAALGIAYQPPKTRSTALSVRQLTASLRQHRLKNAFFILWAVSCWTRAVLLATAFVQLNGSVLPPDLAKMMNSLFALVSALSALAQPLIGFMFDRIGLRNLMVLSVVVELGLLYSSACKAFPVRIVAMCVQHLSTYAWWSVVISWAGTFCPPSLLGLFAGIVSGTAGAVQLGAFRARGSTASIMGATSTFERLFFPALLYGGCAVFFGLLTSLLLTVQGVPHHQLAEFHLDNEGCTCVDDTDSDTCSALAVDVVSTTRMSSSLRSPPAFQEPTHVAAVGETDRAERRGN